MRCSDAAGILTRLSSRDPAQVSLSGAEEAIFQDLQSAGYVAAVAAAPANPEELDALQEKLAGLQRDESKIRDGLSLKTEKDRAPDRARLAALAEQEATVRGTILDLADRAARLEGSVAVDGKRVAVTYRGKELLASLSPRLPRLADAPLEEYERARTDLRRA